MFRGDGRSETVAIAQTPADRRGWVETAFPTDQRTRLEAAACGCCRTTAGVFGTASS